MGNLKDQLKKGKIFLFVVPGGTTVVRITPSTLMLVSRVLGVTPDRQPFSHFNHPFSKAPQSDYFIFLLRQKVKAEIV